tara:strand:- start:379 stop:1251 length:873 start_codon:yes stop_codon:yes gene_type:complete
MANTNLDIFNKNGFLHLENCYAEKEIDDLRKKIKEISNKSRNIYLLPSTCLKHKEIYKTIFNQRLVQTYREIIQDEVYLIPELHVQVNQFPKNKNLGWHFDGQSERENEYLKATNRKFFRVGIYLQDNTNEYGGGIDVLKGNFFKKLPLNTSNRVEKKIIQFYSIFFSKTIKSKKGSVVFFDSRLPHKGTFPEKNPSDVDFIDKYTIYFQVGNKEHCTYFLNNSVERMFKNFNNQYTRNYFLDYLKLNFPNEYPTDFLKMLNSNNIKILTSTEEESKFYKEFEKFKGISK